jgi:sporulation related protein
LIGQDDPFAGTGRQGASARGTQPQPGHDDHPDQYDQAAYDAHYGRADEAQYAHDQQYADDQQYEQGQYAEEYYDDGQAYTEEGYEEPAPQKRRGALTIVAAVAGLAVLGTAGVYGYRALTGPASTSGEPPVIKAEQSPMKVVPPAPSSETQAPKAYVPGADRGNERVVPREEQPVDPRSFAKTTPPAPPAGGSVLPPLAGAAPQPAVAPAPAPGSSEPKKVKTVAIRPDQPQGVPTQPAAPAQQPPARVAATPPAATAAPTPARPSAGGPGHYVQVSSQVNEADAMASFKSLQAKYPTQLGDQQPTIRRVDLSDKGIGIRYRTLVGPFASSSEAKQFCDNYKAAGGTCIANPR